MRTITDLARDDEQALPRVWYRPAAYDVLRIVLGLVLLSAAVLKAWQLVAEPTPEKSLLTSRWLQAVAVEIEWLLALWLLSGLHNQLGWRAATACLSLFAAIALYKTLSGEASCGCFGTVHISPKYTFGFDVLMLALLATFRPRTGSEARSSRPSWRCQATVMVVGAGIGAVGAVAMACYSPTKLTDTGWVAGSGKFVVLEPMKWVGHALPLLDHIDIGNQLAAGEWIVILYHSDCPSCENAMLNWDRLRWQFMRLHPAAQNAWIEISPSSSTEVTVPPMCTKGQLSRDKEWITQTPTVLVLVDGKVIQSYEGWSPDGP